LLAIETYSKKFEVTNFLPSTKMYSPQIVCKKTSPEAMLYIVARHCKCGVLKKDNLSLKGTNTYLQTINQRYFRRVGNKAYYLKSQGTFKSECCSPYQKNCKAFLKETLILHKNDFESKTVSHPL